MRQALRNRLAISGLALTVLAVAGPSAASPYVQALTAAYDQNTGFNVSNSGQVAGPLATAESGPFHDDVHNGAQVLPNSFHAKAFAEWDAVFGPKLGTLSEVSNTFPLYQAFTPAEAKWSETFTVLGTPGTQVSFMAGIHLHDLVSDTIFPNYPDNLGAVATVDYVGMGAFRSLQLHDSSRAQIFVKTVWQQFTYNVGDVVTVGFDLSSDATAQGGAATADAFSTGYFALHVLTAGGGYTTENGGRFLDSFDGLNGGGVPEPETYALLILGFGVLGAALRRRRPAVA